MTGRTLFENVIQSRGNASVCHSSVCLAVFGNYFNRLRVFVNRVLRRVPGPKREEIRGQENCIMRNFVICTHQTLI
jgi:hypothetical protein